MYIVYIYRNRFNKNTNSLKQNIHENERVNKSFQNESMFHRQNLQTENQKQIKKNEKNVFI